MRLLSDNSPVGPISYSTHFACRTEYPTTHPSYGNGRLDILIQLDDVVIGIENKFFAEFQDGQPQKYCPTLDSISKALGSINHTNARSILFILCPENRRDEAKRKTGEVENIAIISWEEVLKVLDKIETISNPTVEIIAREFRTYLRRHFTFIDDFDKKYVHLRRLFPDYGSPYQGELVGKLWSLFPSSGGRLSNGKTWIGYYFYTDPEIKHKGWFGFIPAEDIEDYSSSNKAELIIASTYAPDLSSEFKQVMLKDYNFIGAPKKTHYWVVEFKYGWKSIDMWREKLSPFWKAADVDAT